MMHLRTACQENCLVGLKNYKKRIVVGRIESVNQSQASVESTSAQKFTTEPNFLRSSLKTFLLQRAHEMRGTPTGHKSSLAPPAGYAGLHCSMPACARKYYVNLTTPASQFH